MASTICCVKTRKRAGRFSLTEGDSLSCAEQILQKVRDDKDIKIRTTEQ